ncbi:MAG: hypothetical protein QXV21_02630 [Candidatus Bathyarchaeia archaeon]
MRWYEITCVLVLFVGVVLFLYGANYYDALIGWTGVALVVGAFFVEVFLKVYEILSRRDK